MDIIKETQNGTKLLDVIGLSLRKHQKRLEFLPIHSSTSLTHSGQILRMISDDDYYLDDLSEESTLYLPRMNRREICICWSINKLESYQSSRGELLTQLCIETLSTLETKKKNVVHLTRSLLLDYISLNIDCMTLCQLYVIL